MDNRRPWTIVMFSFSIIFHVTQHSFPLSTTPRPCLLCILMSESSLIAHLLMFMCHPSSSPLMFPTATGRSATHLIVCPSHPSVLLTTAWGSRRYPWTSPSNSFSVLSLVLFHLHLLDAWFYSLLPFGSYNRNVYYMSEDLKSLYSAACVYMHVFSAGHHIVIALYFSNTWLNNGYDCSFHTFVLSIQYNALNAVVVDYKWLHW